MIMKDCYNAVIKRKLKDLFFFTLFTLDSSAELVTSIRFPCDFCYLGGAGVPCPGIRAGSP